MRIGVLDFLGGEAPPVDWSRTAAHLERALPGVRVELARLELDALEAAVQQGALDFVITNSGHAVTLEASAGLARIATLHAAAADAPERAIGSAVVVRADRPELQRLADLRGRRLAAVAPAAFGGYLVAARELLRLGLDPERDLAALRFTGYPMHRVLQAVQRGEADAGVLRACMLERLEADGVVPAGQLRVLPPPRAAGAAAAAGAGAAGGCRASTPLYPDWPFAATPRAERALVRAVAAALLAMPPTADGDQWTAPADYRAVHALYQDLKLGPYEGLRAATLASLARRYWPALLAAALALLAWVAHTVRVEHAVHARTAALSRALEARAAAEARARDHQAQLDHLSRLSILGELSGTLAHELNQPLATIGNYAASLVRRAQHQRLSPDAVAEAGGEIAAQARRAGAIVAGIRAFARKRAARRERVELAACVAEALAFFRSMLREAPPVSVDDRLAPGAAVEADGLQLQQVLLNLLKNAADASAGLPPERRALRVTLAREGRRIAVSVSDRGPGLPAQAAARLFEPFFTTKPDGLGLGLSICRSIAEAHGGRLDAAANPDGCGMSFTLSLPAEPEPEASPQRPPAPDAGPIATP